MHLAVLVQDIDQLQDIQFETTTLNTKQIPELSHDVTIKGVLIQSAEM